MRTMYLLSPSHSSCGHCLCNQSPKGLDHIIGAPSSLVSKKSNSGSSKHLTNSVRTVASFLIVLVCLAFASDVGLEPIFVHAEARPLRVGVMGALIAGTPIGDVLYAAIDGARAALYEANAAGGIAGRRIELIAQNTNDDNAAVPGLMDTLMAHNDTQFDVMALMPGRNHINAAIPALAKHNMLMMCPVAGDRADFEKFNKNLAVLSPIPDAEVEALIRYLVLTRNVRRITIATTYEIVYGNDLLNLIADLLAEFGLTIYFHFIIDHPTMSVPQQLATLAAYPKKPQACILMGALYDSTGVFLSMLVVNFLGILVATPGLLFVAAHIVFNMLPSVVIYNDAVVTTQYTPLSTDTRYIAIQNLRKNFANAVADSLLVNSSTPPMRLALSAYDASSKLSPYMTAGYLVAQSIVSIMRSIGQNGITSDTIINETFSSKLFGVDDWVFGPLSMPCLDGGLRDVMCECNSGARQVLMSKMNKLLGLEPLPLGLIKFSLDTCNPKAGIQSPLIQLIATPTTSALLTADEKALAVVATSQFARGDLAGYINVSTSPSSRTGIQLNFTYGTTADLATKQVDSLITVSTGSIYADTINAVSVNLTVALDPLYVSAPLYEGYTERVIHLGPTLQQEIHAFASSFVGQTINAITTADISSSLQQFFTLSVNTFGYEFGTVSQVTSIEEGLAGVGNGLLFIHGIKTVADINEMNALLGRSSGTTLLVPFQHVTLWYDTMIAIITDPTRRSRVVFATNLPNWNPNALTLAANTTLMKAYYAGIKERGLSYNPQTLRGFLTQRLVANIVERIPSKLTQDTFLSTLYAVSVVVLDANAYSIGPLSSAICQGSTTSTCESNAGARQVYVRNLNMATTSDPTFASAEMGQFVFSSASIAYQPLPTEPGASATIIIIAVIAGCVVVLFIAILVAVCCCTGRSHANAPKDSSKPFSLIFTDIQSSTSLWAEVPDDMAKAIDIHHRLIRELIRKHRGYEVKTIGDAFMIAFKNADDAVRLAYDLQYTFFNCKEFPASIDHAYLAFDREKMMEAGIDGHDTPDNESEGEGDGQLLKHPSQMYIRSASTLHLRNLTAYLSPDDYNRMWRGIRVRIGINTAFGDCKKDEVTQAYDYYGTVTNTAARVESVAHGGQVLMTKGTYEELNSLTIELYEHQIPAHLRQTSSPKVALKMGQVELRGLVDRVELYQLECIAGREYPPLRLDRADDLDEELQEGTDRTTDNLTIDAGTSHRTNSTIQLNIIQPSPAAPPIISTTAASSPSVSNAGQSPHDAIANPPPPAFKLDFGKTHGGGGGGFLGASDNKSDGGASVLSFRPPGGMSSSANVAGELHASHFMAALAAVFSIIPTDKRGKELKKLCDLWRINVDEKKLAKAKSKKPPTSTKNMSLAVGKKDDKMSHRPSEHPSTEPYSRLTSQLTGGDGLSALCLEALAKRLKNVAGKKLSAAVMASGGVGATPNAATAVAGSGLLGVVGGLGRTASNLKGRNLVGGDTASYNGVMGVSPRIHSVRTNHSNENGPNSARPNQITWQISASESNMNTMRASNSDLGEANKDVVTAYSRISSSTSHPNNIPGGSASPHEVTLAIPALTVNVPEEGIVLAVPTERRPSTKSHDKTITIAVPELR